MSQVAHLLQLGAAKTGVALLHIFSLQYVLGTSNRSIERFSCHSVIVVCLWMKSGQNSFLVHVFCFIGEMQCSLN